MSSLDDLPADQRAVLQLVLQRGRRYDDIAAMLSIDRAAVRQRALAALDELGPRTDVGPDRRALITDYLLGQLPPRVADLTRDRLASTPAERAWARVVASELTGLAGGPLPEIPAERARPQPEALPAEPEAPRAQPSPPPPPAEPVSTEPEPWEYEPAEPYAARRDDPAGIGLAAGAGAAADTARAERPARPPAPARRSSRLGGAIVLAVVIVAVIVAIVLATSGGSSHHTSTAASTPTTTPSQGTTTGTATGTSSTTSTTPQLIGQINLTSPSHSSTVGIVQVVRRAGKDYILLEAQHVPPNTKHNAYAIWLYTPGGPSHLLGFVNPGVGSSQRLDTGGQLPTNASQYKQLLVTLETHSNPTGPGRVVLQGALTVT